jgi:hypothetical protein
MKNQLSFIIAALFFTTLASSACNLSSVAPSPTKDPNLAYTQAAQTVQALLSTPSAPAMPAITATPTLPPGTPTEAASPTATPEPSPTATLTPENCTNSMTFVDDITVPDNTVFLPGQTFIKTWAIRNTGTCTWTSAYALVFVDGDQLGATSPIALPTSVPPQTEAEFSVTMTAPGVPGTYRSNWQLRTPNGILFGSGRDGNQPFWAQIVVQEGSDNLDLGSPDWRDPMDDSNNWYLLETPNTRFTIENGRLRMEILQPGKEEWGLSSRPGMSNYFLQATFITGDSCTDSDRYGVLVRAPEENQGYVYGFTCNGRYRLYAWDGATYRALQNWTVTSAIRTGANQTNILGIWLVEDTMRLYANGQLLAEFTDEQFSSGQFGLFIGSADNADFSVYVDEVATWDLED